MNKDSIQDFLNPKASLTIASMTAVVVTIATVLSQDFHINVAYVALGLSLFLSALQTFNSESVKGIVQKISYTLLTGLIIFAGARGGNLTLSNISEPQQVVAAAPLLPIEAPINREMKVEPDQIQLDVQQAPIFKKW